MTVFKKSFLPPEFNRREILRYALCKDADENITALLDKCIKECENAFTYNVCWCELPAKITDGEIDLSVLKTDSQALCKNLSGCRKIILFGATVGIEIDRLIAKYGRISPAKAVMFQAIGAERIEALCDAFNEEIKETYNLYTRQRFSPGYGDFPLEAQKDIFRVLDCPRQIGLSLNESLLMSPSKSVTAIIGISDEKTDCKISCSLCGKTDCQFRSR